MVLRQEVLLDRRFWAALYAKAFGQVGNPPEPAAFCSLLGVNEKDVMDWDRKFTGWHPGIFDDSEGYSDDPATVRVPLANGILLRIEFHPGDLCWFLHGKDSREVMLARIGPHWALPGLRWQEAVALGDTAPGESWIAALLLLPIVWLTGRDDADAPRRAAESSWLASNLVTASTASRLAQLWVSAVEGGRDYHWKRNSHGWLCDAQWSTRYKESNDSLLINQLIVTGGGRA